MIQPQLNGDDDIITVLEYEVLKYEEVDIDLQLSLDNIQTYENSMEDRIDVTFYGTKFFQTPQGDEVRYATQL